MTTSLYSGGCLCGDVRYSVAGSALRVANCHCSMCRRHSGAPFLSYAAFPAEAVRFAANQPRDYRSSSEAVRGHCARCGSPLTFHFDSQPELLWLTIGSLDQPTQVAPGEDWYVNDRLAWVQLDPSLRQWPAGPED